MNKLLIIIMLGISFFLSACNMTAFDGQPLFPWLMPHENATQTTTSLNKIDQLPMYGGFDRNTHPQFKQADQTFIQKASTAAGSREKAAEALVRRGFAYYYEDDLANAMRRFNQAWLLNPNNPDAHWGFAAIYSEQGKVCEARKLLDKVFALGLNKAELYADAARLDILCTVSEPNLSASEKARYLQESEVFYTKAHSLASSNSLKIYVYGSRAVAYYFLGDYKQMIKMMDAQREYGGKPSAMLLQKEKSLWEKNDQ